MDFPSSRCLINRVMLHDNFNTLTMRVGNRNQDRTRTCGLSAANHRAKYQLFHLTNWRALGGAMHLPIPTDYVAFARGFIGPNNKYSNPFPVESSSQPNDHPIFTINNVLLARTHERRTFRFH